MYFVCFYENIPPLTFVKATLLGDYLNTADYSLIKEIIETPHYDLHFLEKGKNIEDKYKQEHAEFCKAIKGYLKFKEGGER